MTPPTPKEESGIALLRRLRDEAEYTLITSQDTYQIDVREILTAYDELKAERDAAVANDTVTQSLMDEVKRANAELRAERDAEKQARILDVQTLTRVADMLAEKIGAAENLLAVIHRDGGHHTADVGFVQSCADAERLLTAPPVPVDVQRYRVATETHETGIGTYEEAVAKEDPDGEYVKFDDVAPFLAAVRAELHEARRLSKVWEGKYQIASERQHELRVRVEELKRDANRLDWLEKIQTFDVIAALRGDLSLAYWRLTVYGEVEEVIGRGMTFREAIDAAFTSITEVAPDAN